MRHLLLATILLGILRHGALADDLTTIPGTIYHNFTVVKAENGFLTINYDEGTASIKADVLPNNIRQQYGLTAASSKPPDHLNELVLKDGTPYLDVTIVKVNPDSLTVLHKDGGAKIPFENLPDYICKLYGISAEGAQEYRATIKQQQQDTASVVAVPTSTNDDNPSVVQESSPASNYVPSDGTVYVHGYYRKNGTYVNGYYRK